jgi:hypothetical protein
MMSADELRAELDAIIDSARRAETWSNEDRKRLKALRTQLGSPTITAQALGIAVATVHWWEKRETESAEFRPPPPERQLHRLHDLIAKKHLESLSGDRAAQEPLLIARSIHEIMERAHYCDQYWVMRSGRAFLAGEDDGVFNGFIKFMKDSPLKCFFVYRRSRAGGVMFRGDERWLKAEWSFESLKQRILADPEMVNLASRVHGFALPSADAFELGLSDPWISYTLAEYSEAGRVKYQRALDVWLGIFVDASEKSGERPKNSWLELPETDALDWRDRRSEWLEKIRQSPSIYQADATQKRG